MTETTETSIRDEVLEALQHFQDRIDSMENRFQRTIAEARRTGQQFEDPPAAVTKPVVMRERVQRTRGWSTSEAHVTVILGVALLAFTGWAMWLWVTYPQADWAMLLNAVVVPAAAWLGKTYIAGRGAEKVERIRQGEPV